MKAFEKYTSPLGMVGAVFYIMHTIVGNLLWEEYNPITMDISSLTATGAPNAGLLRVFTWIYGVCTILFITGLLVKAFRKYHSIVRTGYAVMLVMQLVSLFGYGLFPLTGDKTVMNFQNMMHIMVTVVVVFTTISSGFILAYGYIKQENMKRLGRFICTMTVIMTIAGAMNPISMGAGLNILGLTERLVIYSLQVMMFVLSYYYAIGNGRKESIASITTQNHS